MTNNTTPDSKKSEVRVFNQGIKLSFDDYKLYIDPILAESFNDILEYDRIFSEKHLEENESRVKKEIYSLFRLICSFYFNLSNQKCPFHPGISTPYGDSGDPSDIPVNHQGFLQHIVEKITNPLIRARVADVLWVIQKENKISNAKIALAAYIILVENNFKNLDHQTIEYIQRALFLSRWIKNDTDHKKIIEKFEILIQSKEEMPVSYIRDIILLLIEEKKSNKDLLIQILKDKIKNSNDPDDWSILGKIYNKVSKLKDADTCKIRQGEIYAQRGDSIEDALSKFHWYSESLKVYPDTQQTKSRIKEITTKLSAASNDSLKEMKRVETPLPPDVSSFIQENSREVKEKVSGLGFSEALKVLVSYIQCPSIKELEEVVEKEKYNLLGLFSPSIDHYNISTVNSQNRCESLHSNPNALEEDLALCFTKCYFPYITQLILHPVMRGLEIIRKEHNKIREDDWIPIINKSPLIPKERLKSFNIGFDNWFYKNNLVALPILIPQFENSIRYLIQNSRNDTSVYRNKEKKQEEETFKSNLGHEIIKNKLGEDLALQFKILLITKNGFNLRNKIEHGLVDDSNFSNLECDYFVLLVLKLILFYNF